MDLSCSYGESSPAEVIVADVNVLMMIFRVMSLVNSELNISGGRTVHIRHRIGSEILRAP